MKQRPTQFRTFAVQKSGREPTLLLGAPDDRPLMVIATAPQLGVFLAYEPGPLANVREGQGNSSSYFLPANGISTDVLVLNPGQKLYGASSANDVPISLAIAQIPIGPVAQSPGVGGRTRTVILEAGGDDPKPMLLVANGPRATTVILQPDAVLAAVDFLLSEELEVLLTRPNDGFRIAADTTFLQRQGFVLAPFQCLYGVLDRNAFFPTIMGILTYDAVDPRYALGIP